MRDIATTSLATLPHPLSFCPKEGAIRDGEVGQIALPVRPVSYLTPVREIFDIFMSQEELITLPVVNEEYKPVGALYRFEFLERVVLGRYGYGISLNSRKPAYEVMRQEITVVERSLTLEEAGALVSTQSTLDWQLDLIVTCCGVYHGILPIRILLYYLSEKTLRLARETNPLTGLPGNWAIRSEVERRIKAGMPFEVIYIDLNDFKPYNDHYGFEAGDRVIKALGDILIELASKYPQAWVGHIGGDDFVVILERDKGESFCQELCLRFERERSAFHSEEDLRRNYYESLDRQGNVKTFSLLTLSCAIVPSSSFSSFGELSSRATELKSHAKKISKEKGISYYFKERREKQMALV